jgi:putative transposase
VRVGSKRVARLMREHGLSGLGPRRFRKTTDSKHADATADDLVKRDFAPKTSNAGWPTDITVVRTWNGWLYLAVAIDRFSRRVVGWAIAVHMRTELVLTAFERAVHARDRGSGLVHHSDPGSQRRFKRMGCRSCRWKGQRVYFPPDTLSLQDKALTDAKIAQSRWTSCPSVEAHCSF